MIPVYLYETDGRAAFCVYVILPMPISVSFDNRVWTWDGAKYVAKQLYLNTPVPPHMQAWIAGKEVPEEDRPTSE